MGTNNELVTANLVHMIYEASFILAILHSSYHVNFTPLRTKKLINSTRAISVDLRST